MTLKNSTIRCAAMIVGLCGAALLTESGAAQTAQSSGTAGTTTGSPDIDIGQVSTSARPRFKPVSGSARYILAIESNASSAEYTSLTHRIDAVLDQVYSSTTDPTYFRAVTTSVLSGESQMIADSSIGGQTVSIAPLEAGPVILEHLDALGNAGPGTALLGNALSLMGDASIDPADPDTNIVPMLWGMGLMPFPSGSLSLNRGVTTTYAVKDLVTPNGSKPPVPLTWTLAQKNVLRHGYTVDRFTVSSGGAVSLSDLRGTPEYVQGVQAAGQGSGELLDADIAGFSVAGTLWFDVAAGRIVEWNVTIAQLGAGDVLLDDDSGTDPTATSAFDTTVTCSLVLDSVAP